jgi:hypothetical protein
MDRPLGIAVISVFQMIVAAILVVVAAASALGMSILGTMLGRSTEMGAPSFALLAGAGIVVALVVLLFAFFFGFLGYGMWNLHEWARIATMVLAVMGGLGAAFGVFWSIMHFRLFMLLAVSIRLGINVLILWYLNQQHVIRAFGNARALRAAG